MNFTDNVCNDKYGLQKRELGLWNIVEIFIYVVKRFKYK